MFKLIATKDGITVSETYTTFKQLSKAHHRYARKGWEVTLPL